MALGGPRLMISIQQLTKNWWAWRRRGWRRGTNVGEWRGKPMRHICGWKVREAMYCIIDNRTLLRGGTQQSPVAACVNVCWQPFRPTCTNHHALANRAGCDLSTDAWQSAWVGWKCRQNQLLMVRLLCQGESGSSMFCGCGMAIVQYTSCKLQCPNPTTPQPCETFPLFISMKNMVPRAWYAQRTNLFTVEVILQGWTVGKRWKQGFNFREVIWSLGDNSAHYSAR